MSEDGFAFFGPSDGHFVPEGGFCISVFAVLRKGDSVLLVKARENERWKEWAPNWGVYEPTRRSADVGKWRFPSSYVKQGEAPETALRRVVEDQLGLTSYSSGPFKLLNFYEPSRRYPGKMHWDYCFVFEVSAEGTPRPQPWLAEVEYIDLKSKPVLGSAQDAIFEALQSG